MCLLPRLRSPLVKTRSSCPGPASMAGEEAILSALQLKGAGGPDGGAERDADTAEPIALYFGAQWCAACRRVQERQLQHAKGGFSGSFVKTSHNGNGEEAREDEERAPGTLIYVSFDVDDTDTQEVQAAFPICRRVVNDVSKAQLLMRAYRVRSLPALIFINAKGQKLEPPPFALGPDEWAPPSAHEDQVSSLFCRAIELSNEGDLRGALRGFSEVLSLCPSHADAAFNLAALLQMLGQTALAVQYISWFLRLRPHDRTAHAILGTVLAETEAEAVVEALRALVEQHPDSPWAAHRLACLTGEGASAVSAQSSYVREVFDDLADTFESKLVDHLHYRVPWQLLEAVQSVAPPPPPTPSHGPAAWWRVVDLGCGTGLCGKLFGPYTGLPAPASDGGASSAVRGRGLMLGVDLSPKMAALATQTGAYDHVKVEDVHDTLSAAFSPPLDLVLSADTFIYVGQLERVFHLAARALAPGSGLFAFSIELFAEPGQEEPAAGFKLVMSGRYAHTEAYIHRLCAAEGFAVVVRQDVVVRTEQTRPIPGVVYVLQRTDGGPGAAEA